MPGKLFCGYASKYSLTLISMNHWTRELVHLSMTGLMFMVKTWCCSSNSNSLISLSSSPSRGSQNQVSQALQKHNLWQVHLLLQWHLQKLQVQQCRLLHGSMFSQLACNQLPCNLQHLLRSKLLWQLLQQLLCSKLLWCPWCSNLLCNQACPFRVVCHSKCKQLPWSQQVLLCSSNQPPHQHHLLYQWMQRMTVLSNS